MQINAISISFNLTLVYFTYTDDLVAACENNRLEIVLYLLNDLHCDPNALGSFRQIPLVVAEKKDIKIIRLLLQHGADVEVLYKSKLAALKRLRSKKPKDNPVKMFIIGDGGEGKSTLMAAMQHEEKGAEGDVTGVSQQTAGIVHEEFESKIFGNVQFSDFAGQAAYHGFHSAVIRSSVLGCPPVLILVVSVEKSDDDIMLRIKYWLNIVANQCANIEGKAPLIVVGSRLDVFLDKETNRKREEVVTRVADRVTPVVQRAVNRYLQFDFHGFLPIDCRKMNSPELKRLRDLVKKACSSVKSRVSISLNSHMFHVFLVANHSSDVFITLEGAHKSVLKAQTYYAENSRQKNEAAELSFIPSEYPRLIEICRELTNNGHILFIENQESPIKSFIVIDQMALTKEVNGTIFAPEGFKEHHEIASSTGIVPQSKLVAYFSGYDIDMIVGFLSYRELALPIRDPEILEKIEEQPADGERTRDTKARDSKEVFLFCPGLISRVRPKAEKLPTDEYKYHYCWISYCRHENFFDLRLFQVLLVRLALTRRQGGMSNDSIPSIQRLCEIWKSGISWLTNDGIFVVIQLEDNSRAIKVQMHADKMSLEFSKIRSELINKISNAVKELCPTVYTVESCVKPSEVKYPMKEYSELPLIDFKVLASSIVCIKEKFCKSFVQVGSTGLTRVSLEKLLKIEVYADLGVNLLQALFNEEKSGEKICDEFLCALVSRWSEKTLQFVQPAFDCEKQSMDEFYNALKTWRDDSSKTYECMRAILNKYSVFSGKNLLVSWHVMYMYMQSACSRHVHAIGMYYCMAGYYASVRMRKRGIR